MRTGCTKLLQIEKSRFLPIQTARTKCSSQTSACSTIRAIYTFLTQAPHAETRRSITRMERFFEYRQRVNVNYLQRDFIKPMAWRCGEENQRYMRFKQQWITYCDWTSSRMASLENLVFMQATWMVHQMAWHLQQAEIFWL